MPPVPHNLDNEARAELLCYLVVGQLIAQARTGTWLLTDHVVESARIWLAANGAHCDWPERLELARMSADLAPKLAVLPPFKDAAALARLFTDGWRLDYRFPMVRGIYDVCMEHLMAH